MGLPRNRSILVGWLIGFALLLPGCAGSRGEAGGAPVRLQEAFDPQTLPDDEFLVPSAEERAREPVSRPPETRPPPPAPARKTRFPSESVGPGPIPRAETGTVYRIQVAAVATPERAAEVRKETEQITGAMVLVQHDGLLYKVQLGGFRTRLEADSFLRDVQAKGVRGAFVVASSGGAQTQASVPGSGMPPAAANPAPVAGTADRPAPVQMVPAQGYRVQIHSVTDRGESQRFYEEARRRLNREDIYLQFEPPFFRVRVGNCRTRDLAEDLARELEQAGYEAPFPVRTQILVPESGRSGSE